MQVGSGNFLLRNVNSALIDGGLVKLLSSKDSDISMDTNIEWMNNDYMFSQTSIEQILSPTGSHYIKKGVGYVKNSDYINTPSGEYGEKITNSFSLQSFSIVLTFPNRAEV